MFVEEYKRFYFHDIQALIVHKTESWKVWNIVFACLGALFLIMAIASDGSGATIAAIMAILMVMIMAVNFFKGPSCAAYIQTAVQNEKLHSMVRLKKTQKVLDTLKPLILLAQRNVSAAER